MELLADLVIDCRIGKSVQVAYATSGTFVRNDRAMIAGFVALRFAEEQAGAFFAVADRL